MSSGSLAIGLPPRVRGKDFLVVAVKNRDRITPAYAGKSFVLTL